MADHTPTRPPTNGHRDDDDVVDVARDEPPDEARLGWGTTGLIVVNLAVAVVMAWSGVPVLLASAADVVAFGAVDPVRVWSGEAWRLLSACFVHMGAWHLGLNLWVLWQVGRVLEGVLGTGRFVLVYVVSGLAGFALSLALQPSLTAGASGAVFGVVGALLAVAAVTRHRRWGQVLIGALIPFVVATFAMGILLPMVNNVAHFGGLAMGLCLGFGLIVGEDDQRRLSAVDREPASTSSRGWVVGLLALVVSLGAFAATLIAALQPGYSPRFHATMGLRDLHVVQLRGSGALTEVRARALEHVAAATRLGHDDATTLLVQARAAEVDGDLDVARRKAAAAFAKANDDGDRTRAFEALLADLLLVEPQAEMPYVDGFTVRLLCHAALDEEGRALKQPQLKNACAWLFVMAHETDVRDPALARALASEAHAEAPDSAAITHTLAVALSDTGDADAGVALLEKLAVKGDTSLGAAYLAAERQRLSRLAQLQASREQAASTPTPVEQPAGVDGPEAEIPAAANSSTPATAPTNPAPTNPAPTNPAPTNPAPTNPAPTNPAPTDPAAP
jgi:membrane associated rhomboid family serine protease